MALDNFRLPMPSQFMEDLAEMLAKRPKDALLAPLRDEHNMVLTVPSRMTQTLVLFHA
jgi:hypothetical protein